MDPARALREAVREHCADPMLRERMLGVLARPGYALHPDSPCRATRLTLAAHGAVVEAPDPAARLAAAAVELFMNAAYLLDEVADVDRSTPEAPVRGEQIATATAMLMCGSAAAARAASGARSGTSPALVALYDSAVQSCAGQLLDTVFERCDSVTTDEALRMTGLKSGSIGRLAAGFGARMATASERIVADAEEFGFNLFTFAQLVDDLRDATLPGRDSDLGRGKKTVPLAYFHRFTEGPGPSIPRDGDGRIDREPGQSEQYLGSGAGLFGAVVAETFLNRAKRSVERLRRRGCSVGDLEGLIGSLEAATADAFACIRDRP